MHFVVVSSVKHITNETRANKDAYCTLAGSTKCSGAFMYDARDEPSFYSSSLSIEAGAGTARLDEALGRRAAWSSL